MAIFRFIKESIGFAFGSLHSNKIRSILTLGGVTIGIFSIISVFTLIDYLENSIRSSVQSLGDNVIYIQKWPWTAPENETEYPWWRYLNRPVPKLSELDAIKRNSQMSEVAVFTITSRNQLAFNDNSFDDAQVMGVSHDFELVWNFSIGSGRYFSPNEINQGAQIIVIGAEIAKQLFGDENPLGNKIRIRGNKVTIVGVIEKQGSDAFGNSMDKNAIIPIKYAASIFNIRSNSVNPLIMVKAKPQYTAQDLSEELTGVMRNIRRQKPREENSFALNRISLIQKMFDALFMALNLAGWFIGGFALLVGGFGIANIMFVSVKERTRIIGIQKALGAKKRFILIQFLTESIFLSLLGGVFGLLIVFLGVQIVNSAMEIELTLSFYNISLALFVSASIGILSGYIPALKASRLDPITAMNSL